VSHDGMNSWPAVVPELQKMVDNCRKADAEKERGISITESHLEKTKQQVHDECMALENGMTLRQYRRKMERQAKKKGGRK